MEYFSQVDCGFTWEMLYLIVEYFKVIEILKEISPTLDIIQP